MDFQDLQPGLLIGESNFNLPIQTARTQESRVKGVGAIGGHNHLDLKLGNRVIRLVHQQIFPSVKLLYIQ